MLLSISLLLFFNYGFKQKIQAMKKVEKFLLGLVIMLCLYNPTLKAQDVKISGELRPRYEMRHGYKTLIPDDIKAANFVSQRTRLNAFYGNENYKFYLSLQDVRVWGDVPQLNKTDMYGPSIHEAWGEVFLSEEFSIKAGRQEIIYDDHRMFGSVGWAQQARSHDAALLRFNSGDHKADVGIAYNANGETLFKENYTINSYKTFQYAWYHGKFNNVSLSFLFLNNGLAYIENPESESPEEKIAFSQTIGPRFSYKGDGFGVNAAFYYQGGKNGSNQNLSALYFGADANFSLGSGFSAGAGMEYLSGTDTKEIAEGGDDKSFTPFYGTNHKFNGWMDYFYVGNHAGNVGLTDIFVPIKYQKDKFSATLVPHYFATAATLSMQQPDGSQEEMKNGLGTEIDFMVGYAVSQEVNLQIGYSQMLATETMQVLKGGNHKNSNNWAWVMLTFKPVFYKTTD